MRHRYSGFTLIEVLIVVVIMAVLAATIIPQFTASTEDAKESARDFNTHSLRAQIELYRIDHNGQRPSADDLAEALTSASNAAGTDFGDPGDARPYGPYVLQELPKNPFNESNEVVAGAGEGVVEGGAGWQYKASTGEIWPNDSNYWEDQEEEAED